MRWLRTVVLFACLCSAGSAFADLLPTESYTTVTKTATSTSNQTGTTLWTPATGYRFVLQGCLVSTENAVSVRLQVSSTDVVPPVYVESYGSVLVGGSYAPIYVSAVDAVLTYTTVSASPLYGNVSVLCWGYEVTP